MGKQRFAGERFGFFEITFMSQQVGEACKGAKCIDRLIAAHELLVLHLPAFDCSQELPEGSMLLPAYIRRPARQLYKTS